MPRFLADDQLIYSSASEGDSRLTMVPTSDFMPLEPVLLAVSRSAHQLVVIDPVTLSVVERRPSGAGPHEVAASADGRVFVVPSHGVAITPQAERAWLTCENAGDIAEIEPATGKVVRRFSVGKGAHKVMHLTSRNVLIASNPERGEVYLLNVDDGTVSTIETGRGPEALAASKDEIKAWVANTFDKTLCRIDIETATLDGCWPTGGTFPIALAVDEAFDLIWIARSFSADVAAFSMTDLKIVRETALPSNPLGMALDGRNGRLFLTLPRLNEIIVLDTGSGSEIGRIDGAMEGDDLDFVHAAAFDSPPDT